MPETLNSQSTIVLFGKTVEDLKIISSKKSGPGVPSIARIYGFSHGGEYVAMATPTLLMVHGSGESAMKVEVPGPSFEDTDPFYKSLKAWSYQKTDETMRLDMDMGSFEQVLLSDPIESGAGVSGARVSGARVSGARVSGARVSGARISGARLSGARGDASD